MDPLQLLKLNIEIENTFDQNGDLHPLPGKQAPQFLIARLPHGYAAFFGHATPAVLRHELLQLPSETALQQPEAVQAILERTGPYQEVFSAAGGYFPTPPLPSAYPDVVYLEQAFTVLVAGQPVCRAWTQDQSLAAAELALETHLEHRRRGYAYQAASAWAAHVMQAGRIAFYSYKLTNAASAALAHKLGVILYATYTAYS